MNNVNYYDNDDVKLTNLELFLDKDCCGFEHYYLKAEYEKIDKYRKTKITIPRILLPVNPNHVKIIRDFANSSYLLHPINYADLGFGKLGIEEVDHAIYTEEILEEYPQKMTLDEIEKKLGHKIELVSEK